jgi:hypothetical protein
MIWTAFLAFSLGSGLGFLVGIVSRRMDATRWRMLAVKMARMNDALMDRVDTLESERQKEA